MAHVNAKNGYLTIDTHTADEYTLRSKRDDGVSVELDMDYDSITKLRAILSQLEAPQGEDEDIAILQCQMCGCTLDGTGLDQQKEYVCEDCRARNPTHLPDLQTAQIA